MFGIMRIKPGMGVCSAMRMSGMVMIVIMAFMRMVMVVIVTFMRVIVIMGMVMALMRVVVTMGMVMTFTPVIMVMIMIMRLVEIPQPRARHIQQRQAWNVGPQPCQRPVHPGGHGSPCPDGQIRLGQHRRL